MLDGHSRLTNSVLDRLGESVEALSPACGVVHDDDGSFFAAADQNGVQTHICLRVHRPIFALPFSPPLPQDAQGTAGRG